MSEPVLGIGVFELPDGMLVPSDTGESGIAVRAARAAGQLSEIADEAGADNDPGWSQWNRYVLDPESMDPQRVRDGLPGELGLLVDVYDFMIGHSDTAPDPGTSAGEVRALALSAQASAALSAGEVPRAVQLLNDAADACPQDAPALRALLRGNAAALMSEDDLEDSIAVLGSTVRDLGKADLPVARAELHLELARRLHEQAARSGTAPHAAIHHFYCTVQLVTEQSAPQMWGRAHLGLGTAYLTMPMIEASDTLRSAVAIQSLRAATRVLDQENFPQEWSAATLNLANALVYSPSTHQGDNLVEAVELYEQVLQLRERSSDPLGRARVLANQGNALAHLGAFDVAKAKLVEARFLFEEQLDHDGVMTVRSVLDEMRRAAVAADDSAVSSV